MAKRKKKPVKRRALKLTEELICPGGPGCGHTRRRPRVPYAAATQNWHGLGIDIRLDPKQMDQLNSVPGLYVVSTCSGHCPLMGGDEGPHVNVEIAGRGQAAEAAAERVAARVRMLPDVTIETSYWGGLYSNIVTHVDGKLRTEYEQDLPPQVAQAILTAAQTYPTQRAAVRVESTLKYATTSATALYDWWERVIDALQEDT